MPNAPSNQHELLFATADSTLLAPYGLDAGGLSSVFGQIMSHKVDYADLYFQYQPPRGLEPGGGHRQVGQLQHRPGRGRARGERRKNRVRLFRRHQPAGAGIGRAGHPRDRAPGRRQARRRSRSARRPRAVSAAAIRCQPVGRSERSTLLEQLERYARALDSARDAGDGHARRRIRSGAGGALRRRARRRRAAAGAPVAAGDRRGERPPRAGQRRRRRPLRLRLFHRRRSCRTTRARRCTRR